MHHNHEPVERCDVCRDWPDWSIYLMVAIADLATQIDNLGVAMTEMQSTQAHLDADVQAIGDQFATVVAELKAQVAANQPPDFTKADALVASVTAEATADAPPAPPAPAVDPNAPVPPAA